MEDQQAAAPQDDNQTKAPKITPVDMSSVIAGLQFKLDKEREMLMKALNDPVLLRDFHTFNIMLAGLQASLRAIDTLTGRTDILGQPIKKTTTNVQPAPRDQIDIGGTQADTGNIDQGRVLEAKRVRVPIQKQDEDLVDVTTTA